MMTAQTLHRDNSPTPAKAGAQLGDAGNEPQPFVIKAFPIGPRPSLGWGLVDGSLWLKACLR